MRNRGDYQNKVRFRVYGPDDTPVFEAHQISVSLLQTDQELEGLVRTARTMVERGPFWLDDWSFPKVG